MVTQKKYQHYVPKFYLRFFSNDDKSIGTYIKKHNKYTSKAPLDSIGGEDYLYGKDGIIEDWLSDLEGKWKNIIEKILLTEKLELTKDEYFLLLTFIFFSDARSKAVAETQNEMINYLANSAKMIMSEDDNEFEDDLAKFKIPNYYSLMSGENIIPCFFDLNICLIKNNTSNKFITSDCPLIKYDQYLLNNGYKFGYGYASVGLQCFIPISSKICIYLYDSEIYTRIEKNNIICLNKSNDVYKLNRLFAYNSKELLFFNDSVSEIYIKSLIKNNGGFSKKKNSLFKSDSGEYLILTSMGYVDKNFELSFHKINKNHIKKNLNIIGLAPPSRKFASILMEKINNNEEQSEALKKLERKTFHIKK